MIKKKMSEEAEMLLHGMSMFEEELDEQLRDDKMSEGTYGALDFVRRIVSAGAVVIRELNK